MGMRHTVLAIFVMQVMASAVAQTAPTARTVVLSKRSFHYPMKLADRDQYVRYCPQSVCTCESDIEYVRLLGTANTDALNLINRRLRSDAERLSCKYRDQTDLMHQRVTYLSNHLFSVIEQWYSQMTATGGSCHGSSATHTFDVATGKEYVLGDIIGKGSVSELRSNLSASMVAGLQRQKDEQAYESLKGAAWGPDDPLLKNFKPLPEPPKDREQDLATARQALTQLTDEELLAASLFIENGHVFIDIEGYYFSCAEGSFHPAEIPSALITPAVFREAIEQRQAHK